MSEGANVAYLLVMLILPVSALAARKLPIGRTIKMALAWLAIFTTLLVIVGNRHRVAPVFRGVGDALSISDQSVSGNTVRIRMAEDGHFYASALINGVERRMLIDSGATTTAISSKTAKAAGLDLAESIFPTMLDTANGTISAARSTAARIDVGDIHAVDLPVVVSLAFGDMDVLGMNFLSRLGSWRVEGSFLILEPRASSHT